MGKGENLHGLQVNTAVDCKRHLPKQFPSAPLYFEPFEMSKGKFERGEEDTGKIQ